MGADGTEQMEIYFPPPLEEEKADSSKDLQKNCKQG